jgi:hypothetical protein
MACKEAKMSLIAKSANKKKRAKKLKTAEKITWAGTIIGLIVDLIAVSQIIAVLVSGNLHPSYMRFFITPSTGLVIWGLAFFTYIAFLHLYWENNIDKYGFASKFLWFLLKDLILNFKKPFLLLPFIIWMIVGYPLLSLVSILLPSCYGTLLLLGGAFLFMAKIMNVSANDMKTDILGRVTEATKKEIDEDWTSIENRIRVELERKLIVRYTDFSDLEEVRSYDMQTFWYILALYATKNPESVKFGALWKENGEEDKPSLIDVNVLVDSRILLSKGYLVI